LEIVRLPLSDVKPDAAAKLFAVGHSIAASLFGMQGASSHGEFQPVNTRQVTNIIVQRDNESLKGQRICYDFFSAHPEHPQSQRFVQEWRDECESRGKPLTWRPDEQPQLENECGWHHAS
jgi:hypothetical protein